MIDRDVFNKDMTYLQSLRIVAKGLIQWPLRLHEITDMWESFKTSFLYFVAPFVRIITLILLPISAPIFALIVQRERKRIADSRQRMREDIHRNGKGGN
jgi:hypothetical protein